MVVLWAGAADEVFHCQMYEIRSSFRAFFYLLWVDLWNTYLNTCILAGITFPLAVVYDFPWSNSRTKKLRVKLQYKNKKDINLDEERNCLAMQ